MKAWYFLAVSVLMSCTTPPEDKSRLKSDTSPDGYSITTTIEVMKPINFEAMQTDAQSAQLIEENDVTAKLKVTVKPDTDQLAGLIANPNWKTEYANSAELAPYLSSGVTTNWDASMRADLLAALAQDGIYPDKMNDVDLVKAVSKWIFVGSKFKFLDHFISYDVDFNNGNVSVIPELRNHFDSEKQKNNINSDDEALALGIYGKSMFQARVYGNCTASSTLQATVLKALGIPTRIVLDVPLVDANSASQVALARNNIHHFGTRKTVLEGILQGVDQWSSHTFNEVYVGNRWLRLNYDNLGQKPADPKFLGLMVQVQRMTDWSEVNMGRTWGVHAQARHLAQLSSQNPYRSLGIEDTASVLTAENNPEVPFNEIKTVKLLAAMNSDDTSLSDTIRASLAQKSFFVSFDHQAGVPEYFYIALFRTQVSRKFYLKANGQPDVVAYEDGSWTQSDAVGFRISPENMGAMVAGVEYQLYPESTSGDYRWEPASTLKFVRPSGALPNPDPKPSSNIYGTFTVTSAKVATESELKCTANRICIILALNEDFSGYDPLIDFFNHVTKHFSLEANGQSLSGDFDGMTVIPGNKSGFTLTLDEASSKAMESNVPYRVIYANPDQGEYHWVFPANLTVTKP